MSDLRTLRTNITPKPLEESETWQGGFLSGANNGVHRKGSSSSKTIEINPIASKNRFFSLSGYTDKMLAWIPWLKDNRYPLSPFYTLAIQALQAGEPLRGFKKSVLSVRYLKGKPLFSVHQDSPFFLTPIQQQLNKRTWELFKEAVIQEVGEKKFHAICDRYSIPYQALASGSPFYLKYIKMFHLYLSQFTEKDVTPYGISFLSEQELTRKIHKLYERRCGPLGSILEQTPLAASSYSHLFQDQGKALGILLSQAKEISPIPESSLKSVPRSTATLLKSSFIPWLEIFCKRVVSREFLRGQLIPVPGNKKGSVQWYKVHAKIASCGLVAYALIPAVASSSLSPLLIFRPTQTCAGAEDFIETLRNDLDSAIGKSGWIASESAFAKLMADPKWRANGRKIVVAGFSLGGAHMQYFLSAYAHDVSKAYSFNAPGVDEETAQKFKEKIQLSSSWSWKSPFQLFIFRAEKDLVPLVGKTHVGWDIRNKKGVDIHVLQGLFDSHLHGWIQRHKKDLLSNPDCHLYEIDDPFGFHTVLHNEESPHWLHKIHSRTGWILSHLLYLVVMMTTAIERMTSARLLRQPLQYHWQDS